MSRHALAGLQKRKLRLWLGVFFLALALPTAVLIRQAYSQLKWESIHQHRLLAEEWAARVDTNLRQWIQQEEARAFTDYAFLYVAGDPSANFLQRSPLSTYPVESPLPGVIGYFQVDALGKLSTPLLPAVGAPIGEYGISPQDAALRLALQEQIQDILSVNRLVRTAKQKPMITAPGAAPPAPAAKSEQPPAEGAAADFSLQAAAEAPPAPAEDEALGQAAFDRLNRSMPMLKEEKQKRDGLEIAKRALDSKAAASKPKLAGELAKEMQMLDSRLQAKAAASLTQRRKEVSSLPEPVAPNRQAEPKPAAIRVHTFESEIDPMEFSVLASGQYVLFRKVWRDGQRYVQGVLLAGKPFLESVLESPYHDAAIARRSDLVVSFQGAVVDKISERSSYPVERGSPVGVQGTMLYQTRLSSPLNDMELSFYVTRLPMGAGGQIVMWVAFILTVVLCGGFFLMYRAGIRQLELTGQQQDFVSAVSHELKTPLTSIRMYGELLREGWATEEKKKTYYEYIYNESERLSRLINNVLQLARLTRNDLKVQWKAVNIGELLQGMRPKITAQVERAGFKLQMECPPEMETAVLDVDEDYFAQILINLVDNAVKFAAKATTKVVEIRCAKTGAEELVFSVRDYGPGVPKAQMKKIFKLFYRSESELTRETIGTGIGLALVRQLAQSMRAKVDVVNREPGAEFRITFPCTHK